VIVVVGDEELVKLVIPGLDVTAAHVPVPIAAMVTGPTHTVWSGPAVKVQLDTVTSILAEALQPLWSVTITV
jgi:hypothetical protein